MKHTRVQRRRQTKRKGSRKPTRKHRRQQGGKPGICPAKCEYGNGEHDFITTNITQYSNGTYAVTRYCQKCDCNIRYVVKDEYA